ncbi:MAG: PleD family two-component system response regulator [Paracoccaceae bacterium]
MSGRILVVDDIATNRLILQAKLSSAYFDVLLADSGKQALEIANAELPDMILLDVMMPGIDGYDVCRTLKANPDTAHIPVIMVTAANETEERIRGLEAGADDFLNKPINDMTLFARVRNLLRVKMMFDELKLREATSQELGLSHFLNEHDFDKDEAGSVLLAPRTKEQGESWAGCIQSRFPFEVIQSLGEREASNLAKLELPDAFIVSQNLADNGDGLRLVSSLRANPETRQSAIILVVEDGNMETAAKALELGASDYIRAPFDANEMAARLRSQMRRKKYSDRLRSNVHDSLRMAVIDPLTGLYNRRYATQHMHKIINRAKESQLPFAVMMMDIDRFKSVNDTYGHDAGDKVLKEFARRLQENARGIDLIARLGGEEFLVAMPDTGPKEVKFAAERLRRAIELDGFEIGDDLSIDITVSVGVTFGSDADNIPESLIKQADEALYISKAEGRNRVSYFADAA